MNVYRVIRYPDSEAELTLRTFSSQDQAEEFAKNYVDAEKLELHEIEVVEEEVLDEAPHYTWVWVGRLYRSKSNRNFADIQSGRLVTERVAPRRIGTWSDEMPALGLFDTYWNYEKAIGQVYVREETKELLTQVLNEWIEKNL